MKKNYIFNKSIKLENEFFYAYSPACQSFTKFDFENDCILNRVNNDIDAGFDYVSISLKQKERAPINISTCCSFDKFGAPLIVITENLLEKDGKLFYGNHIEVVAYEEGINIWYIESDEKNVINVKLLGEKKFIVKEKEKLDLIVKINQDAIIANIGDNFNLEEMKSVAITILNWLNIEEIREIVNCNKLDPIKTLLEALDDAVRMKFNGIFNMEEEIDIKSDWFKENDIEMWRGINYGIRIW